MRVLVGMSGGVDSSVAAALLLEEGHAVTGATMKLWGGKSDSGCCSAGEVRDARRVADQLGIEHHVFNYADDFEDHVVKNYVDAHRLGLTPNPCVECNRHIKFGSFLERAMRLGFDAVATGHYARVTKDGSGTYHLERAVDAAKDQSYVLSVLTDKELAKILLPIGALEKSAVRTIAKSQGILTASKPDSQDLCFIPKASESEGRAQFLGERIDLHGEAVVEARTGRPVGAVDAIELVTVGQRRGLARASDGSRHYTLRVDVKSGTVTVGGEDELFTTEVELSNRTWVNRPLRVGEPVSVQTSAHGSARSGVISAAGVRFRRAERKVAPGQVVACYVGDTVVGSGIAA